MTSETTEKEKETNKNTMKGDNDEQPLVTKTKEFAEKLQKLSKPVFEFLCVLLPLLIEYGKKIQVLWNKLDDSIVKSIIGFAFCFFGGFYPTLFSGVQAAEQGGRAIVVESITELATEATRIIEESKKDSKENPDVKELSNKEYMKRKTLFVLQKMNPEKINSALRNIYTVWLAVISVLVVQFARTIQMAASIADFLSRPVDRFIAPVVQAAIPSEYRQWTPVILSWTCKTIGMSLAWTLTSIQIAFASSMQGGLMLSRSGYKALRKRNISLGGLIPDNINDTNFDEYAAYTFAAIGFLFQMKCGLNPPFPLNIILFPFKIGEWSLRYGMMKASSGA
mmetsp:Transcript_31057/g.34740  ORF Transcript_31057/g.34740 Transcript_31057/m.34740 type:complete len:337 (-) Transcript_31057:127-1137(-)|eukprot:CAMPEP_0170779688 /NCGR_PEP_ID=MMETSP0733-20121128/13124_1 /TAXON_ID=186038 /ORGANISM="Fragilariopsis kerguelensis, Strain L26-C5" /LENGTH=336 /DNA_ID=CAMNT_0011123327 /DNA_START=212 /DNA_END=1222 /DNA_ORIENTATION=-